MNSDKCNLCPRECNVDRKNGQRGVCGVIGKRIVGARAALHMWEEPCISGETGSGTLFFSGCPLRCVYCQNYEIARRGGLHIPIVYNCSGYEKVETLRLLEGVIDVYLVDYKYEDSVIAKKYSNAANYPSVVKDALAEMEWSKRVHHIQSKFFMWIWVFKWMNMIF